MLEILLWVLASLAEASSVQKFLSRPTEPLVLDFEPRHFHTLAPDDKTIVFQDVHPIAALQSKPQYPIRVKPTRRSKPSSQATFHESRRMSMRSMSRRVDWEDDEIPAPDVSSNETLGTLARMTFDAYIEPNDSEWYDLDGAFNAVRIIMIFFIAPLELRTPPVVHSLCRPIPSAGNLVRMDSEATYLPHRIIAPLSCPSRVLLQACSVLEGQLRRRTSSTIIYFGLAAALG